MEKKIFFDYELKTLSESNIDEKKLEQYKNQFPDGLLITGYANKSIKDSVGDIVLPEAYDLRRKDILPLLLNHDKDKVIGRVVDTEIDKNGLKIIGYVDPIAEEEFKVISKIKKGLLKTFSIGFIPRDVKYDSETDTYYIKDLELLEVSIVSIPCNAESTMTAIKSFLNTIKQNKLSDENKFKGGETMELKVLLDEIKSLKDEITKGNGTEELSQMVKDLTVKVDELSKEKDALKDNLQGIDEVKSALESVKSDFENIKGITDEVKKLNDTIETLKTEVEELKNAKPKIEVKEVDAKTFDENIEVYKDAWIVSQIFKKDIKDTVVFQRMPERLKSVTLDSTFTTKVSKRFLEDVRANTTVANLFVDFSDVTAQSEKLPFVGSAQSGWGSVPTNNDLDMSNVISFDAKKAMSKIVWTYDEEELAVINFLPVIKKKLIEAIADTIDSGLLSATAITNGPTGLLQYAQDSGFLYEDTATDNKLTAAKVLELRKVLGKYATSKPSKAVVILNTLKYNQIVDDSNLVTMDKIGPNATILTGQVAQVWGHPVILTDLITLTDTEATGNYSALMVYVDGFGIKMNKPLIELDKDISSQEKFIVASVRVAFTPLFPYSGSAINSDYTIVGAILNSSV